MEYKLVSGKSPAELSGAVTEYLKNGWRLYGSPTMAAVGGTGYTGGPIAAWEFCQAVVKEGTV